MRVSIICAASANGVIGVENKLPWKLPADLKRFKALTTGHAVLMGRKTYKSIGKPLPNRDNIVITRQKDYKAPGCHVVYSMEEALDKAGQLGRKTQEIFVIGGEKIFQQALPYANKIYLTRIDRDFEGDAHLFPLDKDAWRETAREEFGPTQGNPYPYTFLILERQQDTTASRFSS